MKRETKCEPGIHLPFKFREPSANAFAIVSIKIKLRESRNDFELKKFGSMCCYWFWKGMRELKVCVDGDGSCN